MKTICWLIAGAVLYASTPGANPVNLAAGKAVTPLTNTVSGSPADVTDGKANNWYSYQSSGSFYICSFTIDLGASYSIGKLNMSLSQTTAFTIWSSPDGATWTSRHAVDFRPAGVTAPYVGGPMTLQVGGAYSARYLKYEGRAQWNQYVGVQEFEVYEWQGGGPAPPSLTGLVNLALGKTALDRAGFGPTLGHLAAAVVDGAVDTYWQGAYSMDGCAYAYSQSACPTGQAINTQGFLRIDLGSLQPIQAIRLRFPAGGPGLQSFSLTVTEGPDEWVPEKFYGFFGDPATFASRPAGTNTATQTFYLPAPVTGRYVWLYAQNWLMPAPGAGPAIGEVEVFGALPAAQTPSVGLVTPSGGNTATQAFTFTFTDPQGYQDLDVVNVLVNNFLDGRVACYLAYSRPLNVLYLVNDAGTALLPGLVLNGSGTLSNSQCTVNGAGTSATGAGNTLTLTLNMTFPAGFGGNRIFYAAARDAANNSGWKGIGTWNVPGLPAGQFTTMGVTPAQGAGNAQTFTFTFTDTFGWQNLGVLNVLINDALDGRFGCYLAYSRPLNVLYLVNDAGTALLPGLLLNGSGTLANSYCTINGAGATATGNGNVVTLTLPVTFSSAFGGNRLLYMAARDVAENNSGWQAKGAWLVP